MPRKFCEFMDFLKKIIRASYGGNIHEAVAQWDKMGRVVGILGFPWWLLSCEERELAKIAEG